MRSRTRWVLLVVLVALGLGVGWVAARGTTAPVAAPAQAPIGTAFTFQGYLNDAGSPADGTYDFQFRLYDAETGGSQVGSAVLLEDVSVAAGLFTVELDFGAGVFTGDARYLEIGVRAGFSTGGYTALTPRQALRPAPYALYAANSPDNDTLAALACGAGQIALWNGSAWECGYFSQLSFSISTVDSAAGGRSSITISPDGLGLISYYVGINNVVKLAHCTDLRCTDATFATGAGIGSTSLAVGTDGLPLISYYAGTQDLKVTHCNDIECTLTTTTTLDTSVSAGKYNSITMGSDGLALISYFSEGASAGGNELRVAHCENPQCTSATITTLDTAGGWFSSVTTGSDGLGLISYQALDPGADAALKVAHCENAACTSATLTVVDNPGQGGNVGGWSSITVGGDWLGLISYQNGGIGALKAAHCENVACTTATVTDLDPGPSVGRWGSITTGPDGFGLVSYEESTNNRLKVAHCDNAACTGATISLIDDVGVADTSITIGQDGLALISYSGGAGLEVIHCGHPIYCKV